MKKVIFILSMLVAFSWQTASADEAEFKALQDSLSIAYGKYFGSRMNMINQQQPKVDKGEFMKGLNEVMAADTANEGFLNGLAVGLTLRQRIEYLKNQNGVNINTDLAMKALVEALNNPNLTQQDMSAANSDLQVLEQDVLVKAQAYQPRTIENKKKGAEYVAQKLAAKEGYNKTASGLVYKVLTVGNGKTYGDHQDVRMKYRGTHVDGAVFDASRDTVTLNSGQVVAGFKEALMLMSPGSKIIAILPSDIAYGDRGAGKQQNGSYAIEPGETLIFEIETYESPAQVDVVAKGTEAKPAAAVADKKGIRAKGGAPAKTGTKTGKKK